MLKECLVLLLSFLTISASEPHKFFDHGDFQPGDYNMFDTFEGYSWQKFEHGSSKYSSFYIKEQADKEFAELLNITFDVDLVHLNGVFKPKYPDNMIYPNLNSKKEDGVTPADYKKDMSEIVANAFRQGYSTRTYTGFDMFRYREDNVPFQIKQIEHATEAHGVKFNLRFNINKVKFCSRLNEDLN